MIFSNSKNKRPNTRKTPFEANEKMTQAAIAKGKAMGLGHAELVEMIGLLDKSLSQDEISSLIRNTEKKTDLL